MKLKWRVTRELGTCEGHSSMLFSDRRGQWTWDICPVGGKIERGTAPTRAKARAAAQKALEEVIGDE